ncbi:thyroid receptor-interacting protein 11-like isoform X2 [Pecten maximus]|uniref:thyroid receptor-interacting protein 11-like isoform X2 n=1 Tax=Pecten maximus TaxID=6579 RepID=UPI0014588AF9|nr:thyroid receptor-interacting protein 11-like isoform X2 [Pecten maximus]
MSWIGGSLSNLTGQLSNLTKDILTEGTEEISDHATELRIAQEKITECQAVITAQKNESGRLKQIIHELEEKAESSELQINSISAQYRGVLEEKEKEINALKQSQQEAFQHQQLSTPSDYGGHTEQANSSTGYHGSFVSDDLDFGDNIGMQHEINRLTQEAQRLRSECQHWKTVAQTNNSEKQGQQNLNGSTSDVLELKKQLKELEDQLRHGKEQQQQEVACVQDVYKQKLTDLRKKFKAEVADKEDTILDLQKQLQSYESSVTEKSISPENLSQEAESLKTRVESLEKERVTHLSQIEKLTEQVKQLGDDLETSQTSREKDVVQLQQTIRDRETEVAALRTEYEKAQALELLGDLQEVRRVIGSEARTHRQRAAREKQELVNQIIQSGNKQRNLKDCVAVLQEEQDAVTTETNEMLTDLGSTENQNLTAGIIDTIEQENLLLKKKTIEQQEQITLLEKALQTVSSERQRSDSGVQSSSDQDQLSITSEMSELSQRNKLLDEQVALLQKQIDRYELDIEQFEVVKSDWQSEKEALEDVLMDLREELRDKENSLNILQAQKGLAEAERRGRRALEATEADDESVENTSPPDPVDSDSDLDNSSLDLGMELESFSHKVELLTQANAQLEYERDLLISEKAHREDEESEEKTGAKSDELIAMEKILATKDDQIAEMTVDNEGLEAHIKELTLQHQQHIEEMKLRAEQQLNTSVDQVSHLQEDLQQLQLDKNTLETSLAESEKTAGSMSAIQEQLDASLCEVSLLKTELQEKTGLLAEAKTEKAELETGLEELDAQNQEAMDQLIRIRDDLVKQLEQARTQGNSAVHEMKNLKQQLGEIKHKLEESERKNQGLQQQLDNAEGQSEVKGESSSEEVQNLIKTKDDLIELVKEVRGQVQEKEEIVQRLEDQLEEAEWQTQEKEEQISNLQQQLVSLREWEGLDDQSDVSDLDLNDLKDKNLTLENDVKRLKQSLVDLQQICDKKDDEIKDVRQKLQSGALAVNNLHMDIKDLEDSLKKSEKTVSEKVETIKTLKKSKVELQTKQSDLEVKLHSLQQSYESLQKEAGGNSETDILRDRLRATDEEISSLKINIKTYKEKLEENTTEKESLQLRIQELKANLEDSTKLNVNYTQQLSEDRDQFKVEISKSSEKIKDLEQKIHALHEERESDGNHFSITLNSLEGKIKDLEEYIEELKKERELDSTSLEAEHQRLMEACHIKGVETTELQGKVEHLESEVDHLRERMASALEKQKQQSDLLEEKENNILILKQEVDQALERQKQQSDLLKEKQADAITLSQEKSQLEEEQEASIAKIREQELMLENLHSLEGNLHSLQEENIGLRAELEDLSRDKNVDSGMLDVVTDLESELNTAKQRVAELELEIAEYQNQVKVTSFVENESAFTREQVTQMEEDLIMFKQTLTSRDDKIRELQDFVMEKDLEISQLNKQVMETSYLKNDNKTYGNREYPDKSETEVNEDVMVKSSAETVTMQNGSVKDEDWLEQESNVVEEMEQLQQVIHEKDKVIRELQLNNTSLLKMMDNKAAKGEHNAMDVHKLENEVRALKMEREQILAVMNEKSRECSNQKSEVHRLMNIISAEKVALDKLTTDNQELKQKKDSPLDDMHKEALQNLSRLVRDKDLEIEALTQKNQTLLQVLQESSGGGMEISNLMQDKDNLMKQLAALQAEREQMVTYLNQKHQESLAYHNEIQRLTSFMNSESEKYTQIQQDFDKLKPQFEDKKQALLKIQNELINYKQKYTELEVKHGELLQRSNASETVDLSSYNSRVEEVKSLHEKHQEMIEVIKDRDSKLQTLHQQCVEWKESIACKDTEISGLRKQLDSLTFQTQGLQTELEDINSQKLSFQQNASEQAAQIQLLKDANSQLTLSLQQREFQLKSLEEKSQTLTAIVQDQQKGTDQQEQVDRLIQENEAILTQARQLQAERDQAMMVVSQHQQAILQLQREMSSQKEREAKALRELERLKAHLIQVEESYTKEALDAEEREKDLRNRLAGAEESLLSSSSAVENASQQASLQVDSLHQQLMSAATQRDQAYLQISSLQDQVQQYSMSLANLQMVLEQFQQEKEVLVATEVERYQRENSSLQNSMEQLQKELVQTKESLSEAEDGLEAAARLMEQLDRKEEALAALKEEVQLRETALKAAEDQISELRTIRESKVEKVVIKNLFLGYFTTPKGQQQQVLKAIGGVLGFTPTDYEKISILNKSWMPGFLRFGGGTPSPLSSPVHTPHRQNTSTPRADKSFSELFVKFLEKESSPPPPSLRLPAEEMVLDVQKQKDKPAYNPFTAPRHVAMPGQTGTSAASHDSHILMSSAPMSPTLAVFTPVTAHTTPINTSSEILKDVLSAR